MNLKQKFDLHFDPLVKTLHQSLWILFTTLILVGSSLTFSLLINQKVNQIKNKLSLEKSDYDTIKNDKGILLEYYPLFIEMNQAGLIRPENRLNWIETLQRSAQQLKIKTLKYHINKQSLLEDIAIMNSDFEDEEDLDELEEESLENSLPFNIYASKMSLELGMLHEGDFLKLISSMKAQSNSFFIVRSCHLSRTEEKLDFQQYSQNISANCELLWISIQGNNRLE